GGYSNNVERDLKRATFLKKNFGNLRLGGYSHWKDGERGGLERLNKTFDVITLNGVGFSALNWLKKQEKSWGFYNQAEGNRDNPYQTFGRSLWGWSRKQGFSHYLEWNSSAIQNLPYFDLDGREADVAVGIPSKDGRLKPTLKLFQAAEGLQDFRWLSYLSSHKAFDSKKVLKIQEKFRFRYNLIQSL
ncbi:unnamed protein product, partial [Chrysoparadoxa australica]